MVVRDVSARFDHSNSSPSRVEDAPGYQAPPWRFHAERGKRGCQPGWKREGCPVSIRIFPGFPCLAALLAVISFGQAQDAPLFVDLGPANPGGGLRVPSGGDGTNAPATVGGSACRVMWRNIRL